MTESLAKKAAEKAWKKHRNQMTPEVRACVRPSDLVDWMATKTDYYLATSKLVQLSGTFDAPQFANDYIRLARKTEHTSRLRVMVRGETVNKNGAPAYQHGHQNPFSAGSSTDLTQTRNSIFNLSTKTGVAKNSIDVYGASGKSNVLMFAPEDLHLITEHDHPLYDERVHLPLDEAMVLNIMALGVRQSILVWKDPESGKTLVIAGRQRVKHTLEADKRLAAEGKPTLLVPAVDAPHIRSPPA